MSNPSFHHTAADPHLGEDAVVIGGSLAGLLAAHTLAGYYARVTILERDGLMDPLGFRPGAPQARHAHTLLPEGQAVFEQLFPGLTDELVAGGAVSVDPAREMLVFIDGEWRAPRSREAGPSIAPGSEGRRRVNFTRPFLEAVLRRRVAAHPNVVFLASQEVLGLAADVERRRATGVRLRRRGALGDGVEVFPADLVVDASGRGSQAARWLTDLGYAPPGETVYTTHTGYASRLYRRPAPDGDQAWQILYLRPRPPAATRGALLLPVEGDRWLMTLIGVARDYPPTEAAGFEAFARALPASGFAEALRRAEPLGEPHGFQQTESRWRHFESLPRWLGNFLVCGDAALTLNPVYALGMTAAGLGALTLEACLRAQHQRRLGPAELAQRFQTQLAGATTGLWRKVTREDRSWPQMEVYTLGDAPAPLSEPARLAPAGVPADAMA